MATKMQIQTLKGPNDQSVVFGDLKPWKNTWLVHVKVLHAWKQYIQSVETMEFVLADETDVETELEFPYRAADLSPSSCRLGDETSNRNSVIKPSINQVGERSAIKRTAALPPLFKFPCSVSGMPGMYAVVEISWESTCSFLILRNNDGSGIVRLCHEIAVDQT